MKARRINADKPQLWKADIAASVDQFNQWFMRFAPEAFRSTRVETTEHVKAALLATNDLRTLSAAMLKANPGALSTLRMCTAPPLAVDRLIGLADASKNLTLPHSLAALGPGHFSMARQPDGPDRPRLTTSRNWGYSANDRAT
ncbi:MAG: XamI family restriction endonuclease [Candidatus Tectomicrobia bacterium]|uniref:XamI family restriction endonuclease n=1 Tax=Tectimicrobiota bacterium TaxID=2528274 RepID=A0A932GQ25_UNCTE|nr:XamI family restriction endonuclease [Candidatus Tectomicrobia bacterium]